MRGFWGEIHRRGAEIAEVSQRFNREPACRQAGAPRREEILHFTPFVCLVSLWEKNTALCGAVFLVSWAILYKA